MESIDRSALLPYTPHEMFELVIDADSYPQFMPWCCGAEILSHEHDEMVARIDFSVGGICRSFTTHNYHQPDTEVNIQLVDGPFSQLQGRWRFAPLGEEGCKISLELDFEISRGPMAKLFGKGFGKIADRLVEDFCRRAELVYRA